MYVSAAGPVHNMQLIRGGPMDHSAQNSAETYINEHNGRPRPYEQRCWSAHCLRSLFCCYGFILSQTSIPRASPPKHQSSWQPDGFYTVAWLIAIFEHRSLGWRPRRGAVQESDLMAASQSFAVEHKRIFFLFFFFFKWWQNKSVSLEILADERAAFLRWQPCRKHTGGSFTSEKPTQTRHRSKN